MVGTGPVLLPVVVVVDVVVDVLVVVVVGGVVVVTGGGVVVTAGAVVVVVTGGGVVVVGLVGATVTEYVARAVLPRHTVRSTTVCVPGSDHVGEDTVTEPRYACAGVARTLPRLSHSTCIRWWQSGSQENPTQLTVNADPAVPVAGESVIDGGTCAEAGADHGEVTP
ncbi:hypothetical protein AB0I60_23425 [Actinosynnema sp. NPDC050436]|uniref:hypothetical protein n=1 Tax=Actinosynnema sp. NPDC050436 TaxID=3155659 RepID=UPI0034078824